MVHHGRVPAAGLPSLIHWFASRNLTGMKVPVVPCGRLVVISGILAGGTLGFRNVMFCFCTFPGPLATVMFLCLFVLRKAHPLQHISCFEFA